jgi:hypothetical protein
VDLGLIAGKRERHSFKTKEEAGSFAEIKRSEKVNEGVEALSLPQEVRVQAAKATNLLKDHGVSLLDVTQYYLDHVIAYQSAPSIPEIVQRMLEECTKNQRRQRSISDLKCRLNKFADGIPAHPGFRS